MSSLNPDTLHRTAKQLFDSGQARSLDQAQEMLETWVLQLDIGAGIEGNPAAQAAVLTAVNAGGRAFLGGVRARCEENPVLSEGWAVGQTLSAAVERIGGSITETLDPAHPTVTVGAPSRPTTGSVVMHVGFDGWCGGVLQDPGPLTAGSGIAPAGVLAAALGVAEAFQHRCGSSVAGRRNAGLSLWEPGADWRSGEGSGPELSFLPARMWLLGLGHLGQAYAWCLGLLPYAEATDVTVFLMDTDSLVAGNLASGLLSSKADLGAAKTRVVAERLQSLGFQTRIVERRFDENTKPTEDEPTIALAGFDSPVPRRLFGQAGFGRVVDAGLGAGAVEYLDIMLHTFPSQLDPAEQFTSSDRRRALPDRYNAEVESLVAAGAEEAEAQCGIVQVAGVSVAAAFVGAAAGALVLSDVLRMLHDGAQVSVLSLDLRTPEVIFTAQNTEPGDLINPGFTAAVAPAPKAW